MPPFHKTVETYRQGARTLPGRYYTSPDVFAEEAERIGLRHWHCVGRADELAGPGAYFLRQLAGESLIVLRDSDGEPRAFYNVCRHDRGVAGLSVRDARAEPRAARPRARTARGARVPVRPAGAQADAAHRIRRAGQLEARLPELLRMPALP